MKALPILILLLLIPFTAALQGYEDPRNGFSVDTQVSVLDTAVYNTGYLSSNGSDWQAFNLSGQERSNWVLGEATSDIDLSGVRYVAIFSCSWNSGWNCGNTWQVLDRGEQTIQDPLNSSTDSVQGDWQALMALYESTNGDNWENNDGWGGSAESMGDWYGVETNSQVRVISIKLNGNQGWDIPYFKGVDGVKGGNNLVGTLPPELGNLKKVRYFNVKQNALTGQLPQEIGDMQELEVLLLNGRLWDPEPGVRKHHNGKTTSDGGAGIDEKTNLYSGEIPATFGNLSQLQVLELIGQREDTDTGVQGNIPPQLGELTNLLSIEMAFNELDGNIPEEIFGMENLLSIDLGENNLEGTIPASINDTWSNLVYLNLGHNQLSGEMPELSNLKNLKYFGVTGNKLTGSLEWMQEVNWTQELAFTFDFNADFYNQTAGFTGNLPDLTTLNGATTLRFQGNRFSGEIPQSITSMSRVIILALAWNDLTGKLPQTGWESFTGQLRHFTVNSNQLTGNIPANLIENADNPNLQNLRFNDNNFTSMDVQAASNLQHGLIDIANNRLTFKDFVTEGGVVPSTITGYDAQQEFGQAISQIVTTQSNYNFDFETTTHPNNEYQWYKDEQILSGQTNKVLTIPVVQASDAGEYTLQVTNTAVPSVTLHSQPLTLTVEEDTQDLSDEILEGSTLEATEHGNIYLKQIVSGLERPWAIEFLPDSRMLVTERVGNIRIVTLDGSISEPLNNELNIHYSGQGGLLDIRLHPDFQTNNYVYMTFSGIENGQYMTHLARARLINDDLQDYEVLFRGQPTTTSTKHYGSRIAFDEQNRIYFSIGDRGSGSTAQNLNDHRGSIIRLNDDGSIPQDNPFVGAQNTLPEIFAYGVRNPQGMATNPYTGDIWEHEHGPQGGDEVNIIYAADNYGWPEYTEGEQYGGGPIGSEEPPENSRLAIHIWTPSIAPSGMTFYTGSKLSPWTGNILLGALATNDRGRRVVRLEVTETSVTHEEQFLIAEIGRIREIQEGPDEYIYVVTDSNNGEIYRLGPFEQ